MFNTVSPKYSFVGTNEQLKHQYGVYIPNYAESLDAIWGVFNKLQLKSFNVSEISELNTGFAYEACTMSPFGVQDIYRRAETPAIALCELLIAINPSPNKAKTERVCFEETDDYFMVLFNAPCRCKYCINI